MSPRIPTTCSSSLICANWDTNCVLSAGFSGSWFWICATRSCKNISSVGVVELAELPDADEVEEFVVDEPVRGLTIEAIKLSCKCGASAQAGFEFVNAGRPVGLVLLAAP